MNMQRKMALVTAFVLILLTVTGSAGAEQIENCCDHLAIEKAILKAIDENPLVSQAGYKAFGAIVDTFKNRQAGYLHALKNGAMSQDERVLRFLQGFALGLEETFGPEPVHKALYENIKAGDNIVRNNTLFIMGAFKTDLFLETLIATLKNGRADMRRKAATALDPNKAEKAFQALTAALKDPDARVRQAAVKALALKRPPKGAEAIWPALQDADADVREQAMKSLAELEAFSILQAGLTDGNEATRWGAAAALAEFIGKAIQDQKVTAVLDPDERTLRAIFALEEDDIKKVRSRLVSTSQNHKTSLVKASALWILAKKQREDLPDLPLFIAAVRSKEPIIKLVAIKCLGEIIGDRPSLRVMEALIPLSKEDNQWTQLAAMEALAEGTPQSSELVPVYAEALNGTVHMKNKALWELGKIGSTEAIGPLSGLLSDPDQDIRRLAVHALGRIGSAAAVPALSAALQDTDWKVGVSAADALRRIGSQDAVPALSRALSEGHPYTIRAVSYALAVVGSQNATPVLIQDLNHFNAEVRASAARYLRYLNSTPAAEALIAGLRDPESAVRAEAIRSLGKLGSAKVVKALLDTLEFEQERAEQDYLVETFKTLDATAAVEGLTALLKAKDPHVKKKAAWFLGKIGSDAAVPKLVKALQDDNAKVRGPAAVALGEIGSNDAVPHLVAAFGDKNEKVAAYAVKAVGQIQAPAAVPALTALLRDDRKRIKRAAIRALGDLGSEQAVPELAQTLKDPDKRAQVFAAHALKKIGSDRIVPLMAAVLEDGKAHVRSKSIAIDALGRVGSAQSVKVLIDMLQDGPAVLREEIIFQLGRLRAPEAIPALLHLSEAPDPRLRLETASALAEFPRKEAVPILTEMAIDETATVLKTAPYLSPGQIRSAAAFMEKFPVMPGYSANLQVFNYFATVDPIPARRLAFLNWLHGWNAGSESLNPESLARDYKQLEKAVVKEIGAFVENPYAHAMVAYALKERGAYAKALDWTKRATALPGAEKDGLVLQIYMAWIKAECFLKVGNSQAAALEIQRLEGSYLPELTRFQRQIAKLPFAGYTLTLKGLILAEQGRTKESVLSLYKAEEILQKEAGLAVEERERIRKIILAYRARAQREGEKKDADESIRLSEKAGARTRLEKDAVRVALVTRIKMAVGEGDYELAHTLTEKLNLQTYSRHIPMRGIAVTDPARKEVVSKFKTLQHEVDQIDHRVRGAEAEKTRMKKETRKKKAADAEKRKINKQLGELRRERLKKQRALKKYVIGLKRSNPEVAVLLGAQPMEVSRLQENLDEQTVILQYLVTDDRLLLFFITRDDIRIEENAIAGKELGRMVEAFRKAIFAEGLDPAPAVTARRETLGRRLFAATLGMVAEDLPAYRQLVIIPAGVINYLPFAALEYDGAYLIEQWRPIVLSASSLLTVLGEKDQGARVMDSPLLAVANPTGDLAASESEVSAISGLFTEKTVFMGSEATTTELLRKDLRNSVLHLATHGHAGQVENTYLKFADGNLEVEDIWGLYLTGSPLVTLSACETSMGELVANEIVSLANGFIFAGARSIVATLWPVADESTRIVMERFYRGLNSGLSRSEALGQAQASLIKNKKGAVRPERSFAPPLFWAPFVLIGSW